MLGGADGPGGVVLANAARAEQDRFRRSLGHQERRVSSLLDHDAEQSPREVVGKLGELAVAREVGRRRGSGEDRRVERIGEARLEVAVQVAELQGARRLARVVTVDAHRADDPELAGGEGAGLVRAQDRDAAQVLDRRQALHQHAAPAERPRALGEVERHDGRQQLRREADRERDREQERVEDGPVQRQVDRQHGDHEDGGHPEDQAAEGANAALEVVLRRPFGEVARDLPVAGAGAGRRDDGTARAAHDARSEEGEAVAIIGTGRPERGAAGILGRGCRLARERRLVDVQVVGVDDPDVGRHDVSRAQQHEVVADDVVHGDLLPGPVADDGRVQRQAGLEGGHRGLGPGLLDEAQHRAQGDDREDDAGRHRVAHDQADQARRDKDEHERARDLGDEDGEERPAASAADRVRAVESEPFGGGGRGQAGRLGRRRAGRRVGRGWQGCPGCRRGSRFRLGHAIRLSIGFGRRSVRRRRARNRPARWHADRRRSALAIWPVPW